MKTNNIEIYSIENIPTVLSDLETLYYEYPVNKVFDLDGNLIGCWAGFKVGDRNIVLCDYSLPMVVIDAIDWDRDLTVRAI